MFSMFHIVFFSYIVSCCVKSAKLLLGDWQYDQRPCRQSDANCGPKLINICVPWLTFRSGWIEGVSLQLAILLFPKNSSWCSTVWNRSWNKMTNHSLYCRTSSISGANWFLFLFLWWHSAQSDRNRWTVCVCVGGGESLQAIHPACRRYMCQITFTWVNKRSLSNLQSFAGRSAVASLFLSDSLCHRSGRWKKHLKNKQINTYCSRSDKHILCVLEVFLPLGGFVCFFAIVSFCFGVMFWVKHQETTGIVIDALHMWTKQLVPLH